MLLLLLLLLLLLPLNTFILLSIHVSFHPILACVQPLKVRIL